MLETTGSLVVRFVTPQHSVMHRCVASFRHVERECLYSGIANTNSDRFLFRRTCWTCCIVWISRSRNKRACAATGFTKKQQPYSAAVGEKDNNLFLYWTCQRQRISQSDGSPPTRGWMGCWQPRTCIRPFPPDGAWVNARFLLRLFDKAIAVKRKDEDATLQQRS